MQSNKTYIKMKYLGNRNLTDSELVNICSILGYPVKIPSVYYNPPSYLKKGCPMWINYGFNGECDVYECDTDDVFILYGHLVQIIKMLPKRKGYYCKQVLGVNIITGGKVFNEDEQLQASYIVYEDKGKTAREEVPCGNVAIWHNGNEEAIAVLRDYIGCLYNRKLHRGLLISYKANNEEEELSAKLFELTKMEDGLYYEEFI